MMRNFICKRKKNLFSVFLATLVVAVTALASLSFLPFGSSVAETDSANGNVDYALCLTYYTLNTNGLEKISDPNGKEITAENGKIFLKVAGDYLLDYGLNVKTVRSLRDPDVKFSYDGTVKSNYAVGEILVFPKANIVGEIGVYESYYVKLKLGGKEVKSIHSSEIDDAYYMLDKGGNYELIYSCTDNTSLHYTATDSKTFTVTEGKALVINDLPENIYYGESLNIGAVYGLYNGKSYVAELKATLPDGSEKEINSIVYTPQDIGEYTFVATTVIEGDRIEKTFTVNVIVAANSVISQSYAIQSIQAATDLPIYGKISGKALYVEAQNDKAYAYYDKIIDLNGKTKEDTVINFIPYADGESGTSDSVKITLIDIYDMNNTVSVYWWYKKSVSNESYMSVYVSGKEYGGINNESSSSAAGKIRTNYGTVGWGCYFNALNYGTRSRAFNIRYDFAENAIYSNLGTGADVLTKVIDLDDANLLGYSNVWKGFTTGEVYLKIEFTSPQNKSGLFIERICDEILDYSVLDDAVNETCFVMTSKSAEMPSGVVGYSYELPKYVINRAIGGVDVTTEVYKDNVLVTKNVSAFTPSETGHYTVKYGAIDNYGSKVEKSFDFTVSAEPNPIIIDLPEKYQAELFGNFVIPEIAVSGGAGALVVDKKIYFNGVVFTEENYCYIDSADNYEVRVTVTDFNGCTETKSCPIEINADYVSLQPESDIVAVRAGAQYIFPSFETYDYLSDTVPQKTVEIHVNGELKKTFGNDAASYAFDVPDNATDLTVTYYSGKGTAREKSLSKTVSVLPKNFTAVSDFLVYDRSKVTAVTMREGIMFKVPNDLSIKLPYRLPSDGFKISFGVDKETCNFDNLILRLTDAYDDSICVDFRIFGSDGEFNLEVNGDGRIFAVKAATNTYYNYKSNDPSYPFAGKTYYIFDCYFDEIISKLCYLNGTEMASVTQLKNGLDFTGFKSGTVFAELIVDGGSNQSNVILYSVGNQILTSTVENSSYTDKDTKGPIIMLKEHTVKTRRSSINAVTSVSAAYAFDVIQANCTAVSVKIVNPDGNVEYNGVLNGSYNLSLNKYGIYNIVYSAKDGVNNETTETFTVTVVDDVPPKISLSGEVGATYKKGASVTLPTAFVSDNVTKNLNAKVYVKTPDAKYSVVTGGDKYTFSETGTYYIVYSATDGYNNSTRICFVVKVV